MNKITISLLVVLGLASCSSGAKKEEVSEVKSYTIKVLDENGEEKVLEWDGNGEMPQDMKSLMEIKSIDPEVNYVTSATIGIEGMSCQKMCAGLINKTLSGAEGVKACEVNFENKTAVVEYDQAQIGEQKMVKMIEDLHEGQYSVSRVEVSKKAEKQVSQQVQG